MTRSTDVVTEPEQPRDPKPENGTPHYMTPEQPWTAEDELQAEALASSR